MKTFKRVTILTFSMLFVTLFVFAQDEQTGLVITDRSGTEMVYVPAGGFEFGVQENQVRSLLEQSLNISDLNRYISSWKTKGIIPSIEVEVSGFWMDRYEVTVAQYQPYLQKCLEIGFCRETANSTPQTEGNENYPQVEVSWIDAMRYCMQRDARLPTEIEWEYAASGPDNLMFPWGNEVSIDFEPHVYEVGTLAENVSWIGIYDMTGNAAEWVDDLYISRLTSKENINFGEGNRVIRGGSFADSTHANTFSRGDGANVDAMLPDTGIRCARSTDPRS